LRNPSSDPILQSGSGTLDSEDRRLAGVQVMLEKETQFQANQLVVLEEDGEHPPVLMRDSTNDLCGRRISGTRWERSSRP
jgi:hypothetical protein